MRNKHLVLAVCLLSANVLLSAPAQGADSYFELFQLAKKHDTAVMRAEARLTSVTADSDIVLSGLYPHLDGTVGVNYIDQTIEGYQSGPQHGAVVGYNYGVSARMNLLHLPTLMNLKGSNASIRAEEAAVRGTRQDLVVRFADAYLGLLKARQDYQITQKELERVKQAHEQSQMFLKAGMGDIIAVYEAQARTDSVVADLNRSEGNLRIAEQKLSTLVGKPVTEVQDYAPLVVMSAQPENIDWWLDKMEKNDPQIQQAFEGADRSSSDLKSVKYEHLPYVQASGGYVSSKGSVFLPEVETRQWYVGASVTIPIYSGGETTAKVQRAVANQTERRGLLEDVRKQRSENLKQSYYNLVYNVSLVKSLEQKLASAELQLTAVKKGRSIGTRSAIDVLNSEQAYAVAQRDYRNALYDNVLRNILLKNAAGILDDASQVPMLPARQETAPEPALQPVAQLAEAMVAVPQASSGVGVLLRASIPATEMFYAQPDTSSKKLAACRPLTLTKGKSATQTGHEPVIVLDIQGSWAKLTCTASHEEAWLEVTKSHKFQPWKEYLKGKQVLMRAGLAKDSYHVYDADEKQVLQTLTPQDLLQVENVVEQWLLVRTKKVQLGWVRWKDAQGALLVAPQ